MNVVSEAVVTVDNTVKTNVPGLRDFTFIVIFSDGYLLSKKYISKC
jgi:hypothetical protein